MKQISKTAKLSVATLAIMNVTAVVSLRGLPAEAEYGLSSAFYYLFAALVFLIPTALVAAELAAMFADKQGGVFRWVGEAFGKRMGFLAIWLQWVESTIWYPTVLTFGAVSLAFIGMNDAHDMALASNRLYTLVVVLAIYWLATFISLKGMSWVGRCRRLAVWWVRLFRQVCWWCWPSFISPVADIRNSTSRAISFPISATSTTWFWHRAFSFSMPVWRWVVSM